MWASVNRVRCRVPSYQVKRACRYPAALPRCYPVCLRSLPECESYLTLESRVTAARVCYPGKGWREPGDARSCELPVWER